MTYQEALPDHVNLTNAMLKEFAKGKPFTEASLVKDFNYNADAFADNIFRKHFYAANTSDSIYVRYIAQVPYDGTFAQLRAQLMAALKEDWSNGWE